MYVPQYLSFSKMQVTGNVSISSSGIKYRAYITTLVVPGAVSEDGYWQNRVN